MALYLGSSEKLKISLDDVQYYLRLYADPPITNGTRLLCTEENILKDSNGLYVTIKESE